MHDYFSSTVKRSKIKEDKSIKKPILIFQKAIFIDNSIIIWAKLKNVTDT